MGSRSLRLPYLWRSPLSLLERGGRGDRPEGRGDGSGQGHEAAAPARATSAVSRCGSKVDENGLGGRQAVRALRAGTAFARGPAPTGRRTFRRTSRAVVAELVDAQR